MASSKQSVAKWALLALVLIAVSQLVVFIAVSHVTSKALDEAAASAHHVAAPHGGGGASVTDAPLEMPPVTVSPVKPHQPLAEKEQKVEHDSHKADHEKPSEDESTAKKTSGTPTAGDGTLDLSPYLKLSRPALMATPLKTLRVAPGRHHKVDEDAHGSRGMKKLGELAKREKAAMVEHHFTPKPTPVRTPAPPQTEQPEEEPEAPDETPAPPSPPKRVHRTLPPETPAPTPQPVNAGEEQVFVPHKRNKKPLSEHHYHPEGETEPPQNGDAPPEPTPAPRMHKPPPPPVDDGDKPEEDTPKPKPKHGGNKHSSTSMKKHKAGDGPSGAAGQASAGTPRGVGAPGLTSNDHFGIVEVFKDIHADAPVVVDSDTTSMKRITWDEVPKKLVNLKDAALVVLCYDRADYLTETLRAVMKANLHKSIKKYISQDGDEVQTQAVAMSYDDTFEYLSHPRTLPETLKQNTSDPELMNKVTPSTMYLADHYKWVLDELFFKRKHSHIIVLEDDMKVSKDFFQFFEMTAPLLDVDPTLWCVSSWNDNGFQHLTLPEDQLFRTSHFPGLGWMLKRQLWEELSPIFPEDNWDHWMRATTTSRNRECVAPFMSRNFNIGVGGATSNRQFYQQYLNTIQVYKGRGVALGDLSYLLHDRYFANFAEKICLDGSCDKKPVVVEAKGASMAILNSVRPNSVYITPYAKEEYENLAMSMSLHPTPRTHFRFATWIRAHNTDYFLVDRRRSPFVSKHMRREPHKTLRAFPAKKAGVSCTVTCMTLKPDDVAAAVGGDKAEEDMPTNWKCSNEQFDFINDCLVLSQHFDGCPYGCTQGWGEDIPALETWEIGHKPQCLTTEVPPLCDAEHHHTQRLCPCIAQQTVKRNKKLRVEPAATAGSSCDDVCASIGSDVDGDGSGSGSSAGGSSGSWVCDDTQFDYLNKCSTLKKHFPCTACDQNFGADLPNYVSAKKDANAGKCLMMKGEMSCSGAHKNTRRLCPCVPADAASS